MPTTLRTRAPLERCGECGSPDLFATCHHCARSLCEDHLPAMLDGSGQPISKEFAGLGVEKAGPPYHCEDCLHVVKGRLIKYIVAGVAAAAAGIVFMFVSFWLGAVVFLGGGAVAAVAYLADRDRLADEARNRPPLPVLPNIESVEIRETLHGTLILDQHGKYSSSVRPVEGRIEAAMTLGKPDLDRLSAYRKKFRLADGEPVDFSGGFAVLCGPVGLELTGQHQRRTVLPLTGKVDSHPLFQPGSGRGATRWTLHLDHELRITPPVDSIPIWLTPSLVPEQDQRSLELELQWERFGGHDTRSDEDGLVIDRFEPLRILVPVSWGNIERATYDGRPLEAVVGIENDPDDPAEAVRVIECAHLVVTDPGKQRITLAIRFENRIELADTIRGDFEVSFKGALSGLTGISFRYPLGGKRTEDFEQTVQSTVRATFSLSLRGIRYQDLRMVPDRKRAEDRERLETVDFDGVIPDHETVIDLTNTLSDQGYYVKRVVENPPHSGGQANVIDRYWDIAGRRYDGVYPVDFHLVLTGDEVHHGHIRPQAGNTRVQITVQGAYASAPLEHKIEQAWERLRETTVDTLSRRVRARPAAAQPSHDNGQARHAQPEQPAEDRAQRERVLRRRLEEATDAVITGRIPDSTYQEIKAAIERELREL
jgi:hypothetical protein